MPYTKVVSALKGLRRVAPQNEMHKFQSNIFIGDLRNAKYLHICVRLRPSAHFTLGMKGLTAHSDLKQLTILMKSCRQKQSWGNI